MFRSARIATPLGNMVALSDERALYFLGFEKVSKKYLNIPEEWTAPIRLIEQELNQYFKGVLKEWKTPYVLEGTPFQKQVWEALTLIPFGATRSYSELACLIGRQTASRAVASANRANPLALIVPCHRVIYHSGGLGGYAGGIDNKQWLLAHERGVL